jgi:hypothetical protein
MPGMIDHDNGSQFHHVATSDFLSSGAVARTERPFLPFRNVPDCITANEIIHERFCVILSVTQLDNGPLKNGFAAAQNLFRLKDDNA